LQGYVVGAGYEEVVLADTLESATITLRGMLAAQGQIKPCFFFYFAKPNLISVLACWGILYAVFLMQIKLSIWMCIRIGLFFL
jgi:hypothetical protein